MNLLDFLIAGLGFVVIFLTGCVLRRLGQPFSVPLLTVHKLFAVATIAFLVKVVLRAGRVAPLGRVAWVLCIAAAFLFLLAVASGGWLAAVKNMPAAVRALHLVLPILTILSTAVFLYLLFHRK